MKPIEHTVTAEQDGLRLDAVVRAVTELSWAKTRDAIASGKISRNGVLERDEGSTVHLGDVVELVWTRPRADHAPLLGRDAFVHIDTHVVVVHKPSGMSTIPYDENESGTLDEAVRAELGRMNRGPRTQPPNLGIVHRIDKETSGLVVFTRTWLAKESLASQFRAHTTHRRYMALVHGKAFDRTFETHLLEDRGDGRRGSWEYTSRKSRSVEGQRSVTHVRVLEHLNGATLVECALETGRTHQIRIHLSESGNPLLGERVYMHPDLPRIPAPRLMLHAAELGFVHPDGDQPMKWFAPPPPDFQQAIERQRSKP